MGVLREGFDLIFPMGCLICGKRTRGSSFCFDCMSDMVPSDRESRFFPVLSEPYNGDPCPGLGLYMPFAYDGPVRSAVYGLKFKGKTEIGRVLGRLLGSAMMSDGISADALIPVPLSAKRLKERGYNQAELIALGASEITGIPVLPDVLIRTVDTMRQTETRSRGANVDGAFAMDEAYDLKERRVILLDDVATTGHTLHEAATVLLFHGVSFCGCVAFCGNRAAKNAEYF